MRRPDLEQWLYHFYLAESRCHKVVLVWEKRAYSLRSACCDECLFQVILFEKDIRKSLDSVFSATDICFKIVPQSRFPHSRSCNLRSPFLDSQNKLMPSCISVSHVKVFKVLKFWKLMVYVIASPVWCSENRAQTSQCLRSCFEVAHSCVDILYFIFSFDKFGVECSCFIRVLVFVNSIPPYWDSVYCCTRVPLFGAI